MKGRVAITNPDVGYKYTDEIARLRRLGFKAAFLPLECTHDPQKVIATLKGYDMVLAGPELYSAEVLDGIGTLRFIARLGTGIENIHIDAATRRGIAVCNAPGSNAHSVAQHVLAFMLDLSLGITQYDRDFRLGVVERRYSNDVIGKTVGLVGFGNVARIVAQLLRGFDVRILAYDVVRDEAAASALGAVYVDLDELLRESDYVSLHVPMNEKTKNMVDIEFLRKMKPTAYLINTSRGGVVDEAALIKALDENIIAGAGLDVYQTLPAPEHPLLRSKRTVCTPYVAYGTKLGTIGMVNKAIQSLIEFCTGGQISNLINPRYVEFL